MTGTCVRWTAMSHMACALVLALTGCGSQSDAPDASCDQGGFCRDSDCDTICDLDEGYPDRDTDGDGQPDYLDLDSDDDGVDDREEAGDSKPSTPPIDRNMNGVPDAYEEDYPLHAWKPIEPVDEDAGRKPVGPTPMDAAMPDAGDPYGQDAGEIDDNLCPEAQQVERACLPQETDVCNGLDDNCDGEVDGPATCVCQRGEVRSCFTGPPGRRGVGACADGYQVCQGVEFTSWGPCLDSKGPSVEICDGIDNDCNGCTDELVACANTLSCPEPGDPRIPVARPFQDYTLDASDFYSGDDATAFRWRVRGSPCDVLFESIDGAATSSSGKLSYRLARASQRDASVRFSLSGNYAVELEITTPDGVVGCEWVMPVRAPGVRVELCWPDTGPVAANAGRRVDLDLHVARQGNTLSWSGVHDCFHQTCAGATSPWGFANTKLDNCKGSRNSAAYEVLNFCPNPRLDADNRLDASSATTYITENINLDNPTAGDHLRVMVLNNDNDPNNAQGHPTPPVAVGTEPIVNVYCGGQLKASYGGDPAVADDDPNAVVGFDTPGQRWHVADIQVGAGGTNTDCEVIPLTAPAPEVGYWLDDGSPATVAW